MKHYPTANKRSLGTGLSSTLGVALMSCSMPAMAQCEEACETTVLEWVKVQAQAEPGYRTEYSASDKYAVPLLDVPQTITVIPQRVMREQGVLSLRQTLSNVSGITFNAGEGGGGSGDSINIRGFSADANMQVDGLRDSPQVNRTDTFNLESVEVIKGPNSVFGGAGTTGGSINMISKQPEAEAFTRLGAGIGTDRYRRLTLDTNQPLHELAPGAVFRLNLMAHGNDVPGREQIDQKRWGIAPSLTFGLGEPTRLTLSYFHQRERNQPDYGLPARDGRVLAGVDPKNFHGWKNLDQDAVTSDSFTVTFEHDFNDALSLRNQSRYARVQREAVISASHVNTQGLPPGRYKPAGPQGYGRKIETALWINQTSLTGHFDTFGLGHTLVTGAEVSRESYDRDAFTYNLTRFAPTQGFDLYNPPGYWNGQTDRQPLAKTRTSLDDKALYLFDTLALNEQWDLSLGLRYDLINGRARETKADGTHSRLSTQDGQFSKRAGLVYKPTENGRVYLAWGTSFNPSAENLVASGRGLDRSTSGLAPELNETWELGSKWELLDQRLGLEAAVFRVEKNNARERRSDGTMALVGQQRVQGVELAMTGELTDLWNVFANFTWLDSETLKSPATPMREGQALSNTPPRSFNLWTSYELPAGFTLGYGARYVSERNLTSADTAKIPAYWVHNAMLQYQVTNDLELQLNANNLFDKAYVERVRQVTGNASRSSALEYGDARALILSGVYSF
ncbi:putative TonB-dependent receptor BfrD [compost metagenome]